MYGPKTTFILRSFLSVSLAWMGFFCFPGTARSRNYEGNMLSNILIQTENLFRDSVLNRQESESGILDSLRKCPVIPVETVYNLVVRVGGKLSEQQKYNAVIRYILNTEKRLRLTLPPGKETERKLIDLSYLLITSYTYLGMPEQALSIALSALEKARQNELKRESALIYNCLGYIYYMQGEYERADSAYLKAIDINEYYKDKKRLFLNYNNLSASLGTRNFYNKAIEYAYLAIHQLDGQKDKETAMICLRNIAGIYFVNKEHSLAMKNLREVKEYQVKEKQEGNLIDTYRIMFLVFSAENNKDSASFYLDKSLELARKLNRIPDEIMLLKIYASFAYGKGNFLQAYVHLEKALYLKDSIDESSNKARVDNIIHLYSDEQVQHAEDIKTQEALLKESSMMKQLFVFLLLLLVAMSVWLLFRMKTFRRKCRNECEEKVSEKDKKIEELMDLLSEYRMNELEFRQLSALKEKELTTISLNAMRNEEFIGTLRDELRMLLQHLSPVHPAQKEQFYKIISLLNQQESGGLSEEFKYYFENIHPGFYEKLTKEFPTLTPRDLRLCALLRMGLSTKEIADITFRETRSIESARNRLRKKCQLSQQEELTKFFAGF